MNVIIFTCRFGQGHYSVSEAIKEELDRKGHKTMIVDILDYLYPICSKNIYDTFAFMVNKHSNIYNRLNKFSDNMNPPFKTYGVKKLNKLITNFNADIAISTFPICSKYISYYKEKYKNDLKLYTYITDLYPQEEWLCKNTDVYFVAAEKTKGIMTQKGIDESKIVISGIPVRDKFKFASSKKENEKFEVLIMGGGLGLIPIPENLLSLIASDSKIKLKVLVGTNTKLKRELESKFPSIEVIGYTKEVEKHLETADLLITKAGGITIFESIKVGTPLCIIKPFLVQERENASFIQENEMGIVVNFNDFDAKDRILNLINNKRVLKIMNSNMKKFQNSLSDICPKKYYNEREI